MQKIKRGRDACPEHDYPRDWTNVRGNRVLTSDGEVCFLEYLPRWVTRW